MTASTGAPTVPRPGALTALLQALVKAPAGAGWDAPPFPGERIGRFEILREIGRGGFGVVYEARDHELSRLVAFKAVQSCEEEACSARVVAEAEAAARLAHPNIVHLYDLGHSGRGAWLILELLRGRSLAHRLAEGPLPLREAVRVAVEVARGVAHAHRQGVVHRDLKPSNVFLCDDGQVKVLDFGLAQVFGKAAVEGGTSGYMAPEQEAGEPGDERSDVYGLGKVLADLVPPGTRGAPAALAALLGRMTAAAPAARPADGAEALAALLAIQRALEPRRLLKASLATAALAIAGAGLFAWYWQRPLPEGRLLTALADTDNRTGDPDLDGAADLFRLGLEQSARVSVLARSRLLNALEARGGQRPAALDEPATAAAAEEARAQLLVVLDVRPQGDGFSVGARGIDLARRAPAFAVRELALTKVGVADALDRLLAGVRRELRDAGAATLGERVAIAEAAPGNPEAWRHYVAWQRARSEGDDEAEQAALARLLAADPEFPMARLASALAATQGSGADDAKVAADLDAALRGLGRIPPKERAILEAMAVMFEGGTQQDRRQMLEKVASTWPEDPVALEYLGDVLLMNHGDLAAARPYLERAVRAAPLSPREAIWFLAALGDLDGALARARRWAERSPGPGTLAALSNVHRWRGEAEEALAAARRSLAFDQQPGLGRRWAWLEAGALDDLEAVLRGKSEEHAAEWLATQGRWREALVALDRELPAGAPSSRVAWQHVLRLELLANAGAPPPALWREVEAQLRAGGELLCTGWALALAGDLDAAGRFPSGSASTNACSRMQDVLARRARGDLAGALRGAEQVAGVASGYVRGLLLAELGRDREAVAAFRAFRRAPDVPGAQAFYFRFTLVAAYGRSLLHEAAALERLGEREEARRVLGRLLRLWRRADADQPALREARALQAKLAGAGP